MSKLMTIILAICFGIQLPTAAMPVRVCLLDPEERTENCCRDCPSDSKDCCAELDRLPDAPVPDPNFSTPPFVGYVIPSAIADVLPMPVRIVTPPRHEQPPSGIGPPTTRLCVLNVWKL